ncbi:cyclic di-GMP phosphodiesterase Gmr [mine drainage metagenome]|uniref:Cyclic di-GMP phosphodiesterase Gmr n=1 Tax=mine drainage metagenome TaxID=410659 RepID=A0A1J5R8G3_9ZZZZ
MLDSLISPRIMEPVKLLGVALLYALLDKFTLTYLAGNGAISMISFPSGLALAAVLIGGQRYAASVFLGALALHATTSGSTVLMSTGLAAGSALEALLGARLLTHGVKFNPDFKRLKDFLLLILLAGFMGAAIGALIGTTTLLTAGFITSADYFSSLLHWWMGHVLGIILLTPFILVWRRPPTGWLEPRRLVEVALLFGIAFLVGQVVFRGWFNDIAGPYAYGFFMFMFVALAAVRLDIHGTLCLLIMVALQAISGAIHGTGYFAADIASTHLVNYWLYMVTLSLVGVMLATYIAAESQDKELLREQEEFFRMIAENIDDLIAVLDLKGRRLYNSPSYAKLFGDLKAFQHTDSFAELHPDDRERVKQVFRETVRTGVGQRIEFRFLLADGSTRDMESRGGLIRNSKGQPRLVVVVSRDITERKKIEEKIRSLAFYDTLTQLPNRRMLDDRLGQAMAASKRNGKYAALLFLDLDNFKPLNDRYGHNVGDLLLIEVAHRITACVREADTVARFGGDEFVVMLGALTVDKAESMQQAETVAEKIRISLAEPYRLTIEPDGIVIEHHCTSSIGVVLFLDHDASKEEIIRWADMAMYQAKDDGRNLIRFYPRD